MRFRLSGVGCCVAVLVLAVGVAPSVGAQSGGESGSGGVVLVVVNGSSLADVGVAAGLVGGGVGDVVVAAESAGGLGEAAGGVVRDAGVVSGVVLVGGEAALGGGVAAELESLAPGVVVERVSGADRVATAAAAARRVLAGRSGGAAAGVVLADGWSLADVGVAAAVAAAGGADVVLYSGSGSLPDQTRQVLAGEAVGGIVVVGGAAAVPDSVVAAAAGAAGGVGTERVGGKDRVATAALAARRWASGCAEAAVIANGWSQADVGTAAALAAALGDSVVLYTASADGLGSDTRSALGRVRPQLAVVVGDTDTISDDISGELAELGYPAARVTDAAAAARYALDNDLRNCRTTTAPRSPTGTETPNDNTNPDNTPDTDNPDTNSPPDSTPPDSSGTGDTASLHEVCSRLFAWLSPNQARVTRVRVTEGGPAATITATLSEALQTPVTLRLSASRGDGVSDDDYTLAPSTLTFAAGQTQASFTVAANDDSRFEHDETLTLSLLGPSIPSCSRLSWSATALVTLVDTDAPDVAASFAEGRYRVTEGGAPVTITVELYELPQRQVSVPLRIALSGEGRQYSLSRTTLVFAADQTSATFTVTVPDDSLNNDGHRLTLSFGDLPPGFRAAVQTTATVEIVDDDIEVRLERARRYADECFAQSYQAQCRARVLANDYAYEGGDPVQVRVRLDSPPTAPVTIPLTSELRGGAVADDVSYSVEDLSFSFGVGETAKTFTVTAVDDTEHNDGEHVVFGLGDLPDGFVSTTATSVTIHLINDDGAFSRQAGKDVSPVLPRDQGGVTDLWSDGTTVWVQVNSNWVYELDLDTGACLNVDSDSGACLSTFAYQELLDRNVNIKGFWSDGETMWLADDLGTAAKVVAIDFDTGNTVPDRNFALVRSVAEYPPDPESVWSDGDLMWVLDQAFRRVHAYDFDSGDHMSSRTINLESEFSRNFDAQGIWSDGITMWVSHRRADTLYAYDLATGVRRGHLDFGSLGKTGKAWPAGIWSDGRTMWVADTVSGKFYAYNMPVSAALKSLSISDVEFGVFQTGIFSYEGTAAAGTTSVTVTAAAAFPDDATVTVAWEAADATTGTGASATLSAGDNTITVTSVYDADGDADTDNADVRVYTVTVTVPPAADNS
ncbi:Calx-beta domain-containing protein [Candidatus Poriferisodalis sp.]|uniref:Calx-beta domain-containing protein n=1 Tax=Candidatus Poriferisodalis sp. TaxID=3101277 RepID=UPI003B01A52B